MLGIATVLAELLSEALYMNFSAGDSMLVKSTFVSVDCLFVIACAFEACK